MQQGLCSCREQCSHFTPWKCFPVASHGQIRGYWMPSCEFVTLWKPETCGRRKRIATTQKWCRFRWLCHGCFGPWRCSYVSSNPFMYLRCSKEKMMFRLLCHVFFVWQPNLCKKQVLKTAVVCAQAPVWLGTCTSVYVEACVYGIGLYCLVGLCHQSPVTVVSQKQLLHCEDPKVMHRFVPAAFWEPLVGLLRGSLIPFCCHYQDLHMRDLQEKRKG